MIKDINILLEDYLIVYDIENQINLIDIKTNEHIGMIGVSIYKHNKVLYIDFIDIVEEYRRKGLATLLFSEIVKYIKLITQINYIEGFSVGTAISFWESLNAEFECKIYDDERLSDELLFEFKIKL